MSTGLSTISRAQAKQDIVQMRRFVRRAAATPAKARALLIKAGILEKSGKTLAKAYR
jgi:hypothetical protein